MKEREENTMKNREMLMELKKAKLMLGYLVDVADEIVTSTFDGDCCDIDDLIVGDKTVEIVYEYYCRGEYGHESVVVPIEWFDEGFDYEAAYREMKRKEAEEEEKRKAAAKRRVAAKKANKEFETYLKLKQKYDAEKAN